jgi:hypothetical protein
MRGGATNDVIATCRESYTLRDFRQVSTHPVATYVVLRQTDRRTTKPESGIA